MLLLGCRQIVMKAGSQLCDQVCRRLCTIEFRKLDSECWSSFGMTMIIHLLTRVSPHPSSVKFGATIAEEITETHPL